MSRAKELADAHWSYINDVLTESKVADDLIETIGFHYITAMVHGWGHGYEDASKEEDA
jgi:hypothetical protein